MQKNRLVTLFFLFTIFFVSKCFAQAEVAEEKKTDTLVRPKAVVRPVAAPKGKDSVKAAYVNPGKIAGRKAMFKSMMLPGLGQIYNIELLHDGYGERAGKNQSFQKIYTISKIGAIYGGFTVLTMSYIQSSKNYNSFLKELQYRNANNDKPDPNGPYARYSTSGVTAAKDTYRRNKQIVLFSYGLVYIANVVDAYVAARLHFFNIDDKLGFKVMPTMLNTDTMYGFSGTPGLKLSLNF